MASSTYVVPDSISDAKELLYESLISGYGFEIVNTILHKHPDLVNCEYKKENGFHGTPLFTACDRCDDAGYRKSISSFGVHVNVMKSFLPKSSHLNDFHRDTKCLSRHLDQGSLSPPPKVWK